MQLFSDNDEVQVKTSLYIVPEFDNNM